MVNGQNDYFVVKLRGHIKRFTILTMRNSYFGHGQNGYFCGQISWSNFRMTILTMENMDFDCGHGKNFDHLTMVILKFRPWSWSKIFYHMTMTPRRRPNGQKIMIALPLAPPP